MPCNNDLLAANFIDDGARLWLIDYEYSGNNDPCFELGNIAAETGMDADALASLVTSVLRPVRDGAGSPARSCSASSPGTAGRSGARSSTPAATWTSTSGRGRWRSSTSPRPAFTSPAFARLLADVQAED